MDAFKVKKDSWHYRFNRYVEKKTGAIDAEKTIQSRRDFCSYWRHTMINGLWVVMGLAMIASVLFLVFGMITGMMQVGFLASLKIIGILIGMAITLIVIAVVVGFLMEKVITGLSRLFGKGSDATVRVYTPKPIKSKKEPGMIKTKYKSWKGQYCPMVEFE
jgi:hypothetical protein